MRIEHNRTKRLLRDIQELADGWLMGGDHQEMTDKLRLLFWQDSFDELLDARIPVFLNKKLTGHDGKRVNTDEAEALGLLIADGDSIPPMRRLRGVRLDVLKELAQWCIADDLVRMIDGDFSDGAEQAGLLPTQSLTDTRKKAADADIKAAWASTCGNILQTAKLVGIERSALKKRLAALGLREGDSPPKVMAAKTPATPFSGLIR